MVLVWEGVEQDRAPELLADLVQNPQSEHERYIATHVIPDLHGADPTAAPPPTVQRVATIETWHPHAGSASQTLRTYARGATLGANRTNDFCGFRTHMNDEQGSVRGHGLI